MGVDVLHLLRPQAGVPQAELHRALCAAAARLGDVEGIRGRGISGQLAVDARPAPPGVLQLFEDEDSGALARDEAVAVLVERTRGLLRGVVALAQGARGGEARDPEQRDGRFRPAADHQIDVAVLQVAHRLAERVVARRAGGDRRVVHARCAVADGDLTARQVHDDRRNEERTDPPVSLLHRGEMRLFERREPAHAGPDDHASALSQRFVRRQPGVLERQVRRGQAELDEEIVAARFLLVHELRGIEVLHLSRDAARQLLGVEACDRPHAGLAGDGRLPRFLGSDRQGRGRLVAALRVGGEVHPPADILAGEIKEWLRRLQDCGRHPRIARTLIGPDERLRPRVGVSPSLRGRRGVHDAE